jgi:hypothetical protein
MRKWRLFWTEFRPKASLPHKRSKGNGLYLCAEDMPDDGVWYSILHLMVVKIRANNAGRFFHALWFTI